MSDASTYPPRVLALFRSTPRAGRPDDRGWSSGEAMDPLTRTHVRMHLRMAPDGCIEEARYEVRGCPYTVAAAALWAERCLGGHPGRWHLEPRTALEELGAPATKLSRFLVVEDAYRRAALSAGPAPA
jgi:NifU-like N terminal domain